MERYLGLDAHAASCTLAVISERGRKLRDEWGSMSCAPTLWKGIQAAFLLDVRVAGAISSPWGARGGAISTCARRPGGCAGALGVR